MLPSLNQQPEPITARLKACIADLAACQPVVASELRVVLERLQTILNLTDNGDCLFADEIRNILDIPHDMRIRRGTQHEAKIRKRSHRY